MIASMKLDYWQAPRPPSRIYLPTHDLVDDQRGDVCRFMLFSQRILMGPRAQND